MAQVNVLVCVRQTEITLNSQANVTVISALWHFYVKNIKEWNIEP